MAEAQREAKKGQTSRYIGVSWNKQANRWVAVITHQWKHITLGFFNDERAAAEAYDDKAIELRGPRARLNFDPCLDLVGQSSQLPVAEVFKRASAAMRVHLRFVLKFVLMKSCSEVIAGDVLR